MKTALIQMEVLPGQPEKNLENILKKIKIAKKDKPDLIVISEMCIPGYLLGDEFLLDEHNEYVMSLNDAIKDATLDGTAIAYGTIYADHEINERVGDSKPHPNKDGTVRKYNAVYVYQNGKAAKRKKENKFIPEGIAPKVLLPNYRIFDDERYFFSLSDVAMDFGVQLNELMQPFMLEINGLEVAVGFETCEDLWCEDYRMNLEALNPTKMLIENGAEYVVNLSASPWTFGKNHARDRRVEFLKKDCGDSFVPFLYVNCVGAQNNGKNIVTFDGGTTAYNKDGKPVKLLEDAYQEGIMLVTEEDLFGPVITRTEKPRIAQKLDSLIIGMRHLKNTTGADADPKVVIGMSGGIDSALAAAITSIAYGPDHILGINMPYKFNSEKTISAAERTAKALDMGVYVSIPVGEIVEATQNVLERARQEFGGRKPTALNKGNDIAKVRMMVLSNIAGANHAIYTNNGNKVELALGYFTLDADGRGAIAPLGDLTKFEEFQLANYLNEEVFKKEVIPYELIPDELCRWNGKIQPTAELEEDQVDPMKFGYHCAMIHLMMDYKKHGAVDFANWYLDGTLHKKLAAQFDMPEKWGIDIMKRYGVDNAETFAKDLDWVASSVKKAVFKRVQSQAIIMTSKSSYGWDFRESMLPYKEKPKYKSLKTDIIQSAKYTPSVSAA